MSLKFTLLYYLFLTFFLCFTSYLYLPAIGNNQKKSETAYVRINQVGYLTEDQKVGIAFSNSQPISLLCQPRIGEKEENVYFDEELFKQRQMRE